MRRPAVLAPLVLSFLALAGCAADSSNADDNAEVVTLAMSKIDPELRSVLQLKEIDELSYSQIAEIFEIPEGTVGSRLSRARKELKEQLVALGWES